MTQAAVKSAQGFEVKDHLGSHDFIWDKPLELQTQQSIDRVLEFFLRNGRMLNIQAKGDVVTVAKKIVSDMRHHIPDTLQNDMNEMMNYLLNWLCDYCEATNTKFLDVEFSLKK